MTLINKITLILIIGKGFNFIIETFGFTNLNRIINVNYVHHQRRVDNFKDDNHHHHQQQRYRSVIEKYVSKERVVSYLKQSFTEQPIEDHEKIKEYSYHLTDTYIPLHQVMAALNQIVKANDENTVLQQTNITISTIGYVIHKRNFGNNLAFIDLANNNNNDDDDGNNNISTLHTMIKKQEYLNINSSKSCFSSIIKSYFYPGNKLYVEGKASVTTSTGDIVFVITHVKLLSLSRDPQHVKGLLKRINVSTIDENLFSHENELSIVSDGIKPIHQRNAEEVISSTESIKTGLDILDVSSALPGIDLYKLLSILNGQKDVDYLFANDDKSYDKSDALDNNVGIPYAILARNIVRFLGPDLIYSRIVNSLQVPSKKHNRLPIVANHLQQLPKCIVQEINSSSSSHLEEVEFLQTSISDILSSSTINDCAKPVEIEGFIQNRIRFQNSITIIGVIDTDTTMKHSSTDDGDEDTFNDDNELPRIKCILHPDCIINKSLSMPKNCKNTIEVYTNLFASGSKVLLKGYSTYSAEEGNQIIWITVPRLRRCSWRPSILTYYLSILSGSRTMTNSNGTNQSQQAHENSFNSKDFETSKNDYYPFDLSEVAESLALSGGYEEALELQQMCSMASDTERQWRAAEISGHLQSDYSRMGRMTLNMQTVINKFKKYRDKWPMTEVDIENVLANHENDQSVKRNGKIILKKSIDGSRWRRMKRPQLEWMMSNIREVLEAHPDYGIRPLNILDIGGGKGNLANYLASKLGEDVVNVNVVDIDNRAIMNGMMRAKRGALSVRYVAGDASSTGMINKIFEDNKNVDVIVALHACGTLSDVALGHAIIQQAGFVITPCCFMSNPTLKIPSYNLVDGKLEMVSQQCWLDIPSEDLTTLKRVSELQGDIETAKLGIHTISALRAQAALRSFATNENGYRRRLDINIRCFPHQFSTRNFTLIGKLQ